MALMGPSLYALLQQRELGLGGAARRHRAHREAIWGSRALAARFRLDAVLGGRVPGAESIGFGGCVNTVRWSADGRLLVGGGDDCTVKVWALCSAVPGASELVHSQPSGHRGNIFDIQFLPGSNDRHVVSCAADGRVIVGELGRGPTGCWACHRGMVHKLAVDPRGCPHAFLAASHDGTVRRFARRDSAEHFFRSNTLHCTATARMLIPAECSAVS